MGQQQLLLLILATVIVGLATVAGIQAFDENQSQASQDALVQRGTEIGSNLKGLQGKPIEMGGIDLNEKNYSATEIADRLGFSHTDAVIEAEGAGESGRCEIKDSVSNAIDVDCASNEAPKDVRITFDPNADEKVTTSFGDHSVAS